MACKPTNTPDDIDLDTLKVKYREEREKRLRPDGNKQYVEVADSFREYYETDPYSQSIDREPIADDIEVAILGGGFAGLITAARLKESGVEDVRIIEMGADFGGTWYWNRYPGVQCDGESYIYFPLIEELGYMPKERYSRGPEIYEHCQRIGKHYGLYERAIFGTIIRTLRWDEEIQRWRITTSQGDDLRARFVVLAAGPLNKPKLPGIPGIESFQGHSFHTVRWDYDYTGGNVEKPVLNKLKDKRVAIIGTGSTAIQCIPHLGKYAEHLYVFQRTPTYIDERGNQPTDPQWVKTLKPGWQRERQRSYNNAVFDGFSTPEEDLVCDGWGEIARNVAARLNEMGNPKLTPEEMTELRELEDFKAMERIRRRVDDIVEDDATAEALKPWYKFLCKRPGFSDEYLPTFNRSNVTLVDVSVSQGVEKITPKGIVGNGREYPVDCIIFASGFDISTNLRRRFAIDEIDGRNGLSFFDHWGDGFKSLHGMMSNEFPNLFLTGYTQGAVAAAINLMYDQQGGHIAHIIKETLDRGGKTVEPSIAACEKWGRHLFETAFDNGGFWNECTPGYYNKEGGEAGTSPLYGDIYGPGFFAFEKLLEDWRNRGTMDGLIVHK